MSPASRVGSRSPFGLPTDWSKYGEPARIQGRKQKMPRMLGGLALVYKGPGVCLLGCGGKSRCRRGCPDDKIKSLLTGSAVCLGLVFVAVYSRSICLFSYDSLIPSYLYPLKGDPLISSYLGSTWESLGPQVTSSVSFVPLPPSSLSIFAL